MGLAEKLTARAARQGRSAPVACGELGTVTVEALPVRELELLLRQADGQRAVFYAACRELQSAGEELRKAGKIFAPDGIMQFVSDSEAEAAARTVLELSGQADNAENRLPFVQIVQKETDEETAETTAGSGADRLGPVHKPVTQYTNTIHIHNTQTATQEIRPGIVQETGASAPGFGQVSRETWTESAKLDSVPEADKKSQAMGILPVERTQNVVSGECTPIGVEKAAEAPGETLHETESEFGNGLHETTSEFRGGNRESLHEITSEFPDTLHEMTSEYRYGLHETKSDFGEIRPRIPHEMKSEFGETAHETTSEFGGAAHETESELAEAVARRLVEGLRRAKWVRGD